MLTIPIGRQFWEMESDKLMSEVNTSVVLSALVSSQASTIRKLNSTNQTVESNQQAIRNRSHDFFQWILA